MDDRAKKFLLAAIALGLWLNFAATIVRPAMATSNLENLLSTIDSNLMMIAFGICLNKKICN
jgi:hypothetical protein